MQGDTDDSADQIQDDVNPLSLEMSDDEEIPRTYKLCLRSKFK